jgi:hypothetical protein
MRTRYHALTQLNLEVNSMAIRQAVAHQLIAAAQAVAKDKSKESGKGNAKNNSNNSKGNGNVKKS